MAFLALVSIAALVPGAVSAAGFHGVGSAVVAASRCNARDIDDYQAQLRDFAAHPPKGDQTSLTARFADIGEILNSLAEEHNILDNLCTDESAKAPLFAQINAATASGLLLQSQIAVPLNAQCPAAAVALPAAMVGQAWLAVAASANDSGGTLPKSLLSVEPQVRARAAALNLALPAYADTSAFWRDQLLDKAKAAIASCSASASPEPSASP